MNKKALILDFNRTLYDPERNTLYEGVPEMLDELKRERQLFLFSQREGGRDTLLQDLGIQDNFEEAYFVDEKTPARVRRILDAHGLAPENCLIVGDLLSSELAAGREAGLDTIWVRQGRFADMPVDFEPTYTVRSIPELRELLRSIS